MKNRVFPGVTTTCNRLRTPEGARRYTITRRIPRDVVAARDRRKDHR